MAANVAPQCVDDIFIMLIDNDTTSVASLTSMLENLSKRVMSVDVASKALSMIEKQKKDIGLVIANIEMPHIDSHSFITALLHKNIPLILINPETNTKKPSGLLTKEACLSLNKPISENDIKNMLQHVLPRKIQELRKINMAGNQEFVMNKDIDQIETFRANLKRQRTSQASLLGRRPFINTFTTSETYQKRTNLINVEWKTKPGCLTEIKNKRKEWKKVDNKVGRRRSLWTNERHMKFLAAISILGEKEFRPKSILRIMNDPNLTHRQVASHLQKYKAQIERIRDALLGNEWKSTDKTFEYPSDYEYSFKASDLTKNLIASNSLWNSLRKKNSSPSSSITQYLFKKSITERKKNMPKFHVGGNMNLSNHSRFGNVFNNSSINVDYVHSTISNNPPYNILYTDNANHIGLVSTCLGSENLHILSDLPSNVGVSTTSAIQTESEKISIPQYDPSPLHPPRPVFETDVNQIDLDFTSISDSFVPLADLCSIEENYNFFPNNTMNPFETNINQMDWVPSIENHSDLGINMNHMDCDPSGEGYVSSENMISSEVDINQMDMGFPGGSILPQEETNINHGGSVFWEIPEEISPKTNMTNFETNREEMNYVPSDKGSEIPIEDLISFDIDFDENDMPSWLKENGFSERDNHLSSSYLDHDLDFKNLMDSTPHITIEDHDHSVAMNLESTSQQHNTMESCEYHDIEAVNPRDDMEGGDNFDDYRDCMDWIYEVMNKDA